jgi:hypothetical protein
MVNKIPKEWNIWVEATSNEIPNVETVWEKCDFSYYGRIEGRIDTPQLIYQKCA